MRRARAVGLVAATSIFVASIAARAEPFPTRPVFAVRSCNPLPRNWCLLCSTHSGWHVQAYYLWYGTPEVDGEWRHWNHSVLPHWREDVRRRYPSDVHFLPEEGELHSPFYPQLGPYSSADPDVVQKHFHDMVRAGISVAVVSWWGRPSVRGTADTQGVNTDSLIPMVLEQAEVAGLKVAFHLEPYPGRSAASTAEDVEYLQRQYGHAPALFKACKGVVADGTSTSVLFDVSCPEPLPVLFVYDSYHISADDWAALLTAGGSASLRGGDHDAIFIGLWLDRGHGPDLVRGGFDGAYTYFASTGFSFGSTPRHWASMNSLMRRHGALFVPCVGPGYDDSRIRPWNRHNTKNRGDGEYYDSMWNAALSMTPMPAGVGITSWNEWGEGTQIEPAVPAQVPQGAGLSLEIRKALSLSTEYADYGEGGPEKYLDATLGWARQLHSARLEAHQSKCSRLATQFSEVKAQGYYQ